MTCFPTFVTVTAWVIHRRICFGGPQQFSNGPSRQAVFPVPALPPAASFPSPAADPGSSNIKKGALHMFFQVSMPARHRRFRAASKPGGY